MGKHHKIGDIYTWRDRPNRERVMIMTKDGVQEARRYFYLQYHKNEDLKGYRILHLDMNPFNFEEDNLVKVSVKEMNLLLNNKILFKTDNYELNRKMNKKSLLVVRNMIKGKEMKEVLKNG